MTGTRILKAAVIGPRLSAFPCCCMRGCSSGPLACCPASQCPCPTHWIFPKFSSPAWSCLTLPTQRRTGASEGEPNGTDPAPETWCPKQCLRLTPPALNSLAPCSRLMMAPFRGIPLPADSMLTAMEPETLPPVESVGGEAQPALHHRHPAPKIRRCRRWSNASATIWATLALWPCHRCRPMARRWSP